MSDPLVETVFIIGAWTLAVIGVLVLARAVLGDRSRGKPRCPRCWYDMTGLFRGEWVEAFASATPGPASDGPVGCTCPECGREITARGQLFRTRRRWRLAWFAAPLLGLSYAGFVGPEVAERGARGLIPGAVLVNWPMDVRGLAEPDLFPPPAEGVTRFVHDELSLRLKEHRLTRWQSLRVASRLGEAYQRMGRWGVTAEDREVLKRLEAGEHRREGDSITIGGLAAGLTAAGVGVDTMDVNLAYSPGFEPDGVAKRHLQDVLDASMESSDVSWTIDRGVVVIGDKHAVADRARYVVVDLRDLAPVRVAWHHESSCFPMPDADTELERSVNNRAANSVMGVISNMVEPAEWACNGRGTSDMTLVDEMLVIRARPSTLVKVERVLEALRHAAATQGADQGGNRGGDGDGHGAGHETALAAAEADSRDACTLRWYGVRDIAEAAAVPMPAGGRTTEDERADWLDRECAGRLDDLVRRMMETIDPDHWVDNGGLDGRTSSFDQRLLAVWTTTANHSAIEGLLSRVRSGEEKLPER